MTKQTTITERVHGAIPGYTEEAAMQAHLRPYKNATITRAMPAAKARAEQHIRELFTAGQDVPDDVADALVIAEQQDRSAELRAELLAAIASETSNQLANVIRAGLPQAFAQLNEELAIVAEGVATAALDLEGINTAGQAIAAGPSSTAAWSQIMALTGDYEEIRSIQRGLYTKYGSEIITTDSYLAGGIFANAVDCLPYWINRRERACSANFDGRDSAAVAYRDWLRGTAPYDEEQNLREGIWPDAGRVEHLLWASRNATLWAPTPEALRQALTDAGSMTADPVSIIQQEAARDRYYAFTGTTPHTAYTNRYTQSEAQQAQLEASKAAATAQARLTKKLGAAGSAAEYRREEAAHRRSIAIARQI